MAAKKAGKVDLDSPRLQDAVQVLKLAGECTRLAILETVHAEPTNVGALCEKLGLRQPTMSHHLGLLRMGGLVLGRRRAKQVFYEINQPKRKAVELVLKILADGTK